MENQTPVSENPTPAVPPATPVVTMESVEPLSLWQKILGFFSSTLGKTLIFTILFLGIGGYILASSNTVLWKGSAAPGEIDFSSQNIRTAADEVINQNNVRPTSQSMPIDPSRSIPGPTGNVAVLDTTIPDNQNPLSRGISQQDLINQGSVNPNLLNPNNNLISPTDDGAPSPNLTPGAATGLMATCSSDKKQLTLSWTAPTGYIGQGTLAYSFSAIGKKADGTAGNTSIYQPSTTEVKQELAVSEEQIFIWSVKTLWNGQAIANADGTPVTCGPKSAVNSAVLGLIGGATDSGVKLAKPDASGIMNLINDTSKPAASSSTPVNNPPATPTICGNNEYFVQDSTKGSCQKIPAFIGAAGQSEFICGIYSQILQDPTGYKINDATKLILEGSLKNQCKMPIPAKKEEPKKDPLKDPLATVCPTGKYLASGAIPADCKPIPSTAGLTAYPLEVACNQLKIIANQAPLLKMDTNTEQMVLQEINSEKCTPKKIEESKKEVAKKEEPKKEVAGTTKKPTETLATHEVAHVTPTHPTAGYAPKATSETGPAIWIYGIGAAISYFATRRKHTPKK